MKRRLLAAGLCAGVLTACSDSPSGPGTGGTQGVSLAVGGTHAVPAQTTTLKVSGGASGSEYVLVPFAASTAATSNFAFQVSSVGVQAAAGPPSPSLEPSFSVDAIRPGSHAHPQVDGGFHLRLREMERRELTPRVRGGGAAAGARPNLSVAAAVPTPGQLLAYNTNLTSPCAEPTFRTGRVVTVSNRAIVVADTANPRGEGTYSDQDYIQLAQTFDDQVWPVAVQAFGEPADVDGNGRVVIFFTRAVNELTPAGQDWFVGGAFFARDLFPQTDAPGFQGCGGSNAAEMFYMLVPDPQGTVNGNVRTRSAHLRGQVGTIAHEFQHLINASRRLYVVNAGSNWNETTWLNEGLSHIAEELMAYSTSNLSARQNISGERLAAAPNDFDRFIDFMGQNVGRLRNYMENPDTASMIGPDNLATRGAIWSFLRYAADRRGGSETALWRGLVDSNQTGIANLRGRLGEDPLPWMRDWLISLYADDAIPGIDPRYTQPSWNFRSIFPRLTFGGTPVTRYPLRTRALRDGTPESITLRAGSAAYIRFAVPAGTTADIMLSGSGGAALPTQVDFTLVRTR